MKKPEQKFEAKAPDRDERPQRRSYQPPRTSGDTQNRPMRDV